MKFCLHGNFPDRTRHLWRCLGIALVAWFVGGLTWAQEAPASETAELERLRQQVQALQTRIQEMEALLRQIEQIKAEVADQVRQLSQQPTPTAPDQELERLKQEIQQTAPTPPPSPPAATSGALNLNRLNPEITVTGDLLGHWVRSGDNNHNDHPEGNNHNTADEFFVMRELEFGFVSMLDPYSRMKVFASLEWEDGEFHLDLEEAYVEWLALPGRLRLSLGRQFMQVGMLNRWHLHAFPQIDPPLAIKEYMREEAQFGQTGVHVAWLLPRLWSSAGEVVVSLVAGDADGFRGNALTRPAWLAYINNYYDLSDSTFLEFGASTLWGLAEREPRLRHRIWNAFIRFNWTPPERAKYRGLDVWVEVFRNQLEVQPISPLEDAVEDAHPILPAPPEWRSRWGGFGFVEYRLNQRWLVGLRADYVERMDEDGTRAWGLSPVLTFWQSEWVRLRLQYSYLRTGLPDRPTEHRVLFLLTWAAGPHKHENY